MLSWSSRDRLAMNSVVEIRAQAPDAVVVGAQSFGDETLSSKIRAQAPGLSREARGR